MRGTEIAKEYFGLDSMDPPACAGNRKSQAESDKPQDDDVYHLVRRSVQIDGVRWAKDADRTLMVTVTDNETHEQQQLFTDNEPCIKACIAGLGNIVDVEYDENSGEFISMIVGE